MCSMILEYAKDHINMCNTSYPPPYTLFDNGGKLFQHNCIFMKLLTLNTQKVFYLQARIVLDFFFTFIQAK